MILHGQAPILHELNLVLRTNSDPRSLHEVSTYRLGAFLHGE